jgi:hypothetical protein
MVDQLFVAQAGAGARLLSILQGVNGPLSDPDPHGTPKKWRPSDRDRKPFIDGNLFSIVPLAPTDVIF